jgi:hypothetical protein
MAPSSSSGFGSLGPAPAPAPTLPDLHESELATCPFHGSPRVGGLSGPQQSLRRGPHQGGVSVSLTWVDAARTGFDWLVGVRVAAGGVTVAGGDRVGRGIMFLPLLSANCPTLVP